MLIVDTDVLIEILDRKSEKGEEALRRILERGEHISITAINLHEVLYGLNKYAKPVKQVRELPVLSYAKDDAALAADIELRAERMGTAVRRTDAMIAAVVINNGATFYTFDLQHFRPVEALGLKLFY